VLSCCICTHDGAERIEDALWSLVCQTADPRDYEILVVDNASTDAAKLREGVERVAERFRTRGGELSLAVEPRLGLSHAKNRAVAESRGEYVYFLDDDALANPRLVERYLEAIAAHRPDVLGGSVLPLFEVQPPPEMDTRYWPRWSLKHLGDRDRWLGEGEYFLGGNQAVARGVLEAEPFDPELGRRGARLAGGEEWWLGDSRFRRRFVAGGFVFHRVGAERQRVDYLVRLMREVRPGARRRSRVPGSLRLLGEELRLFAKRLWLAARLRIALRRARQRGG
jgi:glycosyltransferase involved in cell wall biosynthesis